MRYVCGIRHQQVMQCVIWLIKYWQEMKITEGIDLGQKGYESVTIQEGANRCVLGNAPLILNTDNIDDYDFLNFRSSIKTPYKIFDGNPD